MMHTRPKLAVYELEEKHTMCVRIDILTITQSDTKPIKYIIQQPNQPF